MHVLGYDYNFITIWVLIAKLFFFFIKTLDIDAGNKRLRVGTSNYKLSKK